MTALLTLAECDARPAGVRDWVMLLLLARLGLRADEVARLTRDNVDWRQGTLHVAGKGRRHNVLPLPPDVGNALATYCRQGEPPSGPWASTTASAVGHTAYYAQPDPDETRVVARLW